MIESAAEVRIARRLLGAAGTVSLGTLAADGSPFVTYATAAPDAGGAPLLLLSQLAAHTRNLAGDPRASLLYVEPAGEDMAAARLTVAGRLVPHPDAAARQLFVAAHPSAARYAGFGDFGLYRMEVATGHLVAGFGRIVTLGPEQMFPTPDRD